MNRHSTEAVVDGLILGLFSPTPGDALTVVTQCDGDFHRIPDTPHAVIKRDGNKHVGVDEASVKMGTTPAMLERVARIHLSAKAKTSWHVIANGALRESRVQHFYEQNASWDSLAWEVFDTPPAPSRGNPSLN